MPKIINFTLLRCKIMRYNFLPLEFELSLARHCKCLITEIAISNQVDNEECKNIRDLNSKWLWCVCFALNKTVGTFKATLSSFTWL